MNNELPKYNLVGQFVKDLSFENLLDTEVGQDENPTISVEPDVTYSKFDKLENSYEITLTINAKMEIPNKKLFIAEVKYCGIVQFDKAYSDDEIEPILYVEVPYYLFFETRNLVSHLTFLSGFGPILLRPVDFAQIYQKKSKRAQQGAVN